MTQLLDTGLSKFTRWAKGLRDVARVSPKHTRAAAELIARSLHGDASCAPRDVGTLLEVLLELRSEIGGGLDDARAREYLAALTAGGRLGKAGEADSRALSPALGIPPSKYRISNRERVLASCSSSNTACRCSESRRKVWAMMSERSAGSSICASCLSSASGTIAPPARSSAQTSRSLESVPPFPGARLAR